MRKSLDATIPTKGSCARHTAKPLLLLYFHFSSPTALHFYPFTRCSSHTLRALTALQTSPCESPSCLCIPFGFRKELGKTAGKKSMPWASKNAWTGRPPAQQMLCRPVDGGVLQGRMLSCSYTLSLYLLAAVYQWYWAG